MTLKRFINSKKIFYSFLLFLLASSSRVYCQADLTLTINDLLNWQPSISNQSNISLIPLHDRVRTTNFQIGSGLDTNAKILYCPDGMDNFGPYIDSANQFNLFNFSHWQYIDILAWFGGSASSPIIIPSKAWVDAAHKNGVKIIGTVFMAPAVFGGSQALVQSFLQQDSLGNFIAAAKMIEMANYYNFDGWILNFETSVNSATGSLASLFVSKLDSAYSGEVIWYDAMLTSGSISYQNKLNANNAYFFQHSTGLFTNYNWTLASTVASSATYATNLGLSPFNVYTGADMWPGRPAQTAFTDYTWIDNIITGGVAKTSIAMFAMNFTFNYGPFSNFNNDPADYNNFYSSERKIFFGIDEDPFVTDNTWKGLVHYIPVRTAITSFPFQTDFNTGHGLNYYANGNILAFGPWHNMSHQSMLPSWTFYKNNMTINYEFNDAFSGGTSLSLSSAAGGTYEIPLFSIDVITNSNILKSEIVIKSSSGSGIDSIAIELKKRNGLSSAYAIFNPAFNGSWENLISNFSGLGNSDTIEAINFNVYASGTFSLIIGKLGVDSNFTSSIINPGINQASFRIFQDSSNGTVEAVNGGNVQGQLTIYDLKGSVVFEININKQSTQQITLPRNNVYIYKFNSGKESGQGKLFVY